MRKTLLVARREFLENARTKTFWLGILAMPAIFAIMTVVAAVFEKSKDVRRYAVVDESGWLHESIEDRAAWNDLHEVLRHVKAVDARDDLDELPSALQGLAPLVKDTDETGLRDMARALSAQGQSTTSAMTDSSSLTPEQRAEASRQATEMLLWRANLDPEDAGNIGGGLVGSRYELKELPAEAAADPETHWRQELDEGRLFAYFVVGGDPVSGSDGCKYVSNNLTDPDLRRWFSRLATDVVRERRIEAEGIDPDVAAKLQESLRFDQRQVDESGEEEEVKTQDSIRQFAPAVFTYVLWIAIMGIANMLLTNTIEEKSNRIIEVLLSSVSPLELMAGKVVGIAATGLTMVGSWVLVFVVGLKLLPKFVNMPADLDLSVLVGDPLYLSSFVFYFLAGYLFYAALLVGLGSTCNSLKDAQNFMTPIMMIMMLPLAALVPVSQDPNGAVAKLLSYIPPFTPYIMMNRAAGPPTTMEYVVTSILLILAIAGMFWAAAKVFRIGILMTGKPPKLRELWRWLKAPVGTAAVRQQED
ncbi:MAG: ABC transporter permease [Acidobacteriota bacterium]